MKSSSVTKAALAVIVALPLVLTACGKDEDASSTAASSTKAVATATATKTSTSAMTSTTETSTEKSTDAQPPAPAPQAPVEPLPNPLENLQTDLKQPTAVNGSPANQADAEQIRNLISGLNKQTTLRGLYNYITDNSCKPILDANGGAEALRARSNEVADALITDSGIDWRLGTAVDDIQTKGQDASANVTSTVNGAPTTQVMRFTREGNSWKMCSEL
ncbi:hypothetical protein [Corynebacterium caspium]|uniref:hypothetical protein n=1 Tax=Corynebacterium caspium TaxID=234828 RepID=UPI0003745426|nr:hypothetical protein [Corynebacterium caspium]WKD59027.1 hypothetical protein CCASP_03115 [Corynebacterium caspium DSM 44850]